MALLKRGKEERKGGGGFRYKPRSAEATQARADRRTGGGDSVVRDDIKFFQAKEGDHDIRYLPPTWDDPEHYGYDVYVHYGIGPDNSSYLCLNKMKGEACPCCEERARAQSEGEDDLAQMLRPSNRVAAWLIDRRAERDGPKMWLQPATFDKEVSAQAVDKKRHSVINLDDPEEGYDVSFTVEGSGLKKKYKAAKPDRSPSPLSNDEEVAQQWLEYVQENPVPDCLVYKTYEEIAAALEGGVRVGDKDKEEDGERRGKRGNGRDEQDEGLKEVEKRGRPRLGKKRDDEEEEEERAKPSGRPRVGKLGKKRLEPTDLTWDEVHAMDEDELEELAKEHDIDEDDFEDCKDESDVADVICERLGIEEEKRPKKAGKKRDEEEEEEDESDRTRKTVESGGSWKDKLRKLRKGQ